MDMILRKSNENEIEKIVELSKKAFDTDVLVGGKENDGPPQYDNINWHKQMLEEGHLYTYMQKNGKIIGGAILFEEGRKLYVGRIFINPQYFGQGYGIQLMREIECYFPDAYVIQLDTPIWNVRTNRFYRKCGYRQMGRDAESVYYEKRKDVYEICPTFEDEKFLLRFSTLQDAKELVKVYGDKNALPFFNSDNCHGDNFYYPDEQRMQQAIKFWLDSYDAKYFVRWTIVEKKTKKAIGSVECFHRVAGDAFDHVGVLRVDVGSPYEKADVISEILELLFPAYFELFHCKSIITKVPVYAVERIQAVKRVGFEKSDQLLVGTMDAYAYKDYWIRRM